MKFAVDEIIFARDINVTVGADDKVGFDSTNQGGIADAPTGTQVYVVWENSAFDRTRMPDPNGVADDGVNAGEFEGQFVGVGPDGPLALMGLLKFDVPTGALEAEATGETVNGTLIPTGGAEGMARFTADGGGAFDPNVRIEYRYNRVHLSLGCPHHRYRHSGAGDDDSDG